MCIPRKLDVALPILACVLLCASAHADGVLIPEPIPHVLARPLPFSVKYHRVDVSIENQTATTRIDQVFVNNNEVDIEGTYIFPIPETASISEFTMWVDGEKLTAELLDAREARQIYEDLVRRMRDPGLLEYAGRDMFRARVYPIRARGSIRIEMSYHELLEYDSGLVSYVYPLNTERFSATDLEDVSVNVEIESDVPIKSLYCPSHRTDSHVSGLTAYCSYEESDVKPDRDFLLYYTVSEEDVGLNLVTHRLPGEDGYYMLLLSPGNLNEPDKVIEKDVVFVLDTSGSMSGEKIRQAQGALEFCLNSLNVGDRFNIITFATHAERFEDGLVPNEPGNLSRALDFVRDIEASGGTNIDHALEEALDMRESPSPKMIVFLTDGLPTAGEVDVGNILKNAEDRNRSGARIFSFGVGYDVNTLLLDRLSLESDAAVEYVSPDEDIEIRVSSFYSKVSNPILSDTSVEFESIDVRDNYPLEIPDVFSGSQIVMFGRYRDHGPTTVLLRGRVGDEHRELVYETRFDRENEANEFIPRLWASRKIAYLMTQIRLHGEDQELKDEIVRLATEHGIVTPYTSFLVDEAAGDDRLSYGGPSGAAGAIRSLFRNSAPSIQTEVVTGKAAFSLSSDLAADRKKSVVDSPAPDRVKHIADRTFYYSDSSGWVESDYDESAPVTEIEYMSDEYFELLDSHPEVGKFFSLGESVTFQFEHRTYRVVGVAD